MSERLRIVAAQHEVDPMDLQYALKALKAKDENKKIEALTYSDLVREKSNRVWDVAENIHEAIENVGK